MKASIAELEEKEKQIIAERDAALVPMGNIVHDSVPISDNEVRKRGRYSAAAGGGWGDCSSTWRSAGANGQHRARQRASQRQ
jgi:hypothetical protein